MELSRLRCLGRGRSLGAPCHITMKVLFMLIPISFSLGASLWAGDEKHFSVSLLLGITPFGRSERLKEDIFIKEDKPSYSLATPIKFDFHSSYIIIEPGCEFGKLRFNYENQTIGEKGGNSLYGYAGFGHSLDKRNLAVPYVGIGYYMNDLPEVVDSNGLKMVGEKYRFKDSPCLVLGLKSKANDRIGFEYNYNSFRRVRHKLTIELSLYSSSNKKRYSMINSNEKIDIALDLLGGGGFDKGSYNVFVGLKYDVITTY